jgi:general secretion pathway protein I
MNRLHASGDRGSAFIESIIAAAIVCMVLGATFQVIADTVARQRQTQSRSAAYLVAQSELAEVGVEIPLHEGQSSGVSGPFAWRIDVAPFQTGQQESAAGALWSVAVSVQPREGGPELANLQTLRLARTG